MITEIKTNDYSDFTTTDLFRHESTKVTNITTKSRNKAHSDAEHPQDAKQKHENLDFLSLAPIFIGVNLRGEVIIRVNLWSNWISLIEVISLIVPNNHRNQVLPE